MFVFYLCLPHIHNYGECFPIIIARPKRNAIIYLLYDSTKSGQREEKSEGGKKRKEKGRKNKLSTPGFEPKMFHPTKVRGPNHSTTGAIELPSKASLRF